jgi:hypothetical protein
VEYKESATDATWTRVSLIKAGITIEHIKNPASGKLRPLDDSFIVPSLVLSEDRKEQLSKIRDDYVHLTADKALFLTPPNMDVIKERQQPAGVQRTSTRETRSNSQVDPDMTLVDDSVMDESEDDVSIPL